MPKIFISYRRRDSAHVSGRIFDILVDQFGRENILKDIDNIRVGMDFREEVERLLGACDVALVVVGPQWIGADSAAGTRRLDEVDDPVRVEIEFAIKRGMPIIPMLFDGMTMEQLKDLPESVATFVYRNGFEIRADPYFRPDMDLVVRRIKTDFPTEAEREAQIVQERLAELERERKLADERQRLADLEAEQQQKREQERQALLAAQADQMRQEEAENQAKAEATFKEKQAILNKQRTRVEGAFIFLIAAVGVTVGVLLGHGIWSEGLHGFAGTVGAVVVIGVLVLGIGFVGLLSGTMLGSSVTGTVASTIIATVGTGAGTVFCLIRGVNVGGGSTGILIGGGLGLLGGSFALGLVGWLMRNEYASPWYVKDSQRLLIPVAERIKPQAAPKTTSKPTEASSPVRRAGRVESAQSAPVVIIGSPMEAELSQLATSGVPRGEPTMTPGYAPCPYCETLVKSPVNGSEPRCPSCGTRLINCRRCATLLCLSMQKQRVEIVNPNYQDEMRRMVKQEVKETQIFGNWGNNRPIQQPEHYQMVDRWIPCPTCGETDPSGDVKKYGDRDGLYKAKGGAVVTRVYPPRLSRAQEALQPPKAPVPVLRTDGLYMAPRSKGFDCFRFYHDDRVAFAYVSIRRKGSQEQAARDAATWLRYKYKANLSGKRKRMTEPLSTRPKDGEDRFYVQFDKGDYVTRTYEGIIESNDFIQLDSYDTGSGERERHIYTFVPAVFKY